MKYTLLIGAILTAASSCFAQADCNKDHPIFNFDNAGQPKEVRALGSNPEFPALSRLSTRQQVLAAMRNGHMSERKKTELNNMLKGLGFENGVRDVKLSSISAANIPYGTTGNMGDGNYNTSYTKLTGNPNGSKAWKITSDKGCYMYFLAKCGNAFAENMGGETSKTACITAPVNITTQPKIITTGNPAELATTEKNVYIYYHQRYHKKSLNSYANAEIPDSRPSKPLLLSSKEKAELVPHEYRVTVTAPDDKVKVCHGKPVEVAANINVEYSSAYTGNYPGKTSEYRKVSKHVYKKSMRKMRRAKHKEDKIARITHVPVSHNS